jgi:hypothetical protein
MFFPELVQIALQNVFGSAIEESIFLSEATETLFIAPAHPDVMPFFTGDLD